MSPSITARRGAGQISNQMKSAPRPTANVEARMIANRVKFRKNVFGFA